MRVLHIAQTLLGGPASYLNELAQFQAEVLGAENVAFLIPKGSARVLDAAAGSLVAEYSPTGRSPFGLGGLALASLTEIKRFRPAIIHLHSTFAGAVVRPIAAAMGGASVVYCAHGWAFGMEVGSWKRAMYAAVERVLAWSTDMIINISYAEEREAIRWKIPASRMRTIRNGISADFVARPTAFSLDPGCLHLLFASRHDRQKGLDVLLSAFAGVQRSDVRLHIAGAPVLSESGSTPRLHDHRLIYHGWLTREEVAALIAEVDAVVIPSRWEGFGLLAIEAMRAGKPVVSSGRGGLGEIVQHKRNGLTFDVQRPEELRLILDSVRKDQLSLLGDQARVDFLREHTAVQMNERLLALYRELRAETPCRVR